MFLLEVNHQRIKTNGIWMHLAEQGTGPLVILLHGFPETWYGWRHQITYLASHGYHVVAPDLRGYGDSDSPLTPQSYTVFHLVGDIIGLLDHFEEQQILRSVALKWRRYDESCKLYGLYGKINQGLEMWSFTLWWMWFRVYVSPTRELSR